MSLTNYLHCLQGHVGVKAVDGGALCRAIRKEKGDRWSWVGGEGRKAFDAGK